VLVIGHNPGLEDLTGVLAGDADEAALDQLQRKFPTGALAVLDVSTEWAALGPGAARLTRLEVPRR
jgi:phosphohistidine phosphatase